MADQIVIDICRIIASTEGCAQERLSVSSSKPYYSSTWTGRTAGIQPGDTVIFTVRIGGLNVGHATLQAVGPLGLPVPGSSFRPDLPLPIVFQIDQNPVVHTRAQHQRGATATQIAQETQSQLAVGDTQNFNILYQDVRDQDLDLAAVPFTHFDLVNATFAAYPSDTFSRAARIAQQQQDARTNQPGFTNQQIVNALAASSKANSENQAGTNSAIDVLSAIQDPIGLDVQDSTQALSLLGGATNSSGQAIYTAGQILQALLSLNPGLSILQALTALYNCCRYAATDSIAAVQHYMPAVTGDAVAGAALQIFGWSVRDITAALNIYIPPPDLKVATDHLFPATCSQVNLPNEAAQLAQLLTRGGLAPGEVVDLLVQQGCSFNAVQIARVLHVSSFNNAPNGDPPPFNPPGTPFLAADVARLLAAHGFTTSQGPQGVAAALQASDIYNDSAPQATQVLSERTACSAAPCPSLYTLLDVAQALSQTYFHSDSGVTQLATDLAATLVPNWQSGLQKPDLLNALGKTLDPVFAPTAQDRECATSVGAINGGKWSLANVVGNLDATGLASEFPNPFSPGSTGNLATLATCLQKNGVAIPFPLLKMDLSFDSFTFGRTNAQVGSGVLAARVGASLGALQVIPPPKLRLPNGTTLPTGITAIPVFGYGTARFQVESGPPWQPWCTWALWCPSKNISFSNPLFTQNVSYQFHTSSSDPSKFSLVVPALPSLKLHLESDYYNQPALNCFSHTNDDLVATAIAVPFGVYGSLQRPGTTDVGNSGRSDAIAIGSTDVPMPSGPTPQGQPTPIDVTLPGINACSRNTNPSTLHASMAASYIGNDPTAPLRQTVVGVDLAQPSESTNTTDFSFSGLSAAPDLSQNYLNLLASDPGASSGGFTGGQIAHILTSGFPS